MQGIIVHPTLCCGSVNAIGRIVEYIGKVPSGKEIRCAACGQILQVTDQILIHMQNQHYGIKPQRVKWFNDDLDLDQEEISKEKEDVTI